MMAPRAQSHWLGPAVAVGALLTVTTTPLLLVVPVAVPAGDAAGAAGASCFAYATDTPKILQTIRTVETGGNYATTITSSSASGAYAFLDATWRHYAAIAG